MPIDIVIEYNAGFSTADRKNLMGANAAAEGFLQGYAKYADCTAFHAMVQGQELAERFANEVRRFHPRLDVPVQFSAPIQTARLAQVGTVHCEDPGFSKLAWMRRWERDTAYSLTGITHTTCTQAVLDHFSQLVIAPFYAWDALICTSQSVKATVEKVLTGWTDYLAERLGARGRPNVELPVIPLGVDCDRFPSGDQRQKARQSWRNSLGIGPNDVVFLFFGRLSFHAKANPFPMYLALEAVARRTGQKLHLILAGWFANDSIDDMFRKSAAEFCPSVKLHVVDGRLPAVREQIWCAADVFTSLSDNIQETFGLTPVEAMAAGLPTVISDWDGYRDTVRHGIDGFRVPTTIAPPGVGDIYMRRYVAGTDNYDRYVGHTAHYTAVDIPRTTEAYFTLVTQPELRERMGQAAAARARETFDWRVIVGRYEQLWSELAKRRRAAATAFQTKALPQPLRPDPFALFAEYATSPLTAETVIGLSPGASVDVLRTLHGTAMLNYLSFAPLLASVDEFALMLSALAQQPRTVGEIVAQFPMERQPILIASCVWLLKTGLVQRNFPG